MGRLGIADELANAIVFIATDNPSFVTRHILNFDDGHSATEAIPVPASVSGIREGAG
jgi:hypothetical protein